MFLDETEKFVLSSFFQFRSSAMRFSIYPYPFLDFSLDSTDWLILNWHISEIVRLYLVSSFWRPNATKVNVRSLFTIFSISMYTWRCSRLSNASNNSTIRSARTSIATMCWQNFGSCEPIGCPVRISQFVNSRNCNSKAGTQLLPNDQGKLKRTQIRSLKHDSGIECHRVQTIPGMLLSKLENGRNELEWRDFANAEEV